MAGVTALLCSVSLVVTCSLWLLRMVTKLERDTVQVMMEMNSYPYP